MQLLSIEELLPTSQLSDYGQTFSVCGGLATASLLFSEGTGEVCLNFRPLQLVFLLINSLTIKLDLAYILLIILFVRGTLKELLISLFHRFASMAQITLGVGAATRSSLFGFASVFVSDFPLLDAAQVHIEEALLSLGCLILTERRERFFRVNFILLRGYYLRVTIKLLNFSPGVRLSRDHRTVHPFNAPLPRSLREVLPYRS